MHLRNLGIFAGGVLSGLMGVGGGIIFVPFFTNVLKLPQKVAHGTSTAVICVTALCALLVYVFVFRAFNLYYAVAFAAGGVLGAQVGARATSRMNVVLLRTFFALIVLLVAGKFLYSGIHNAL